ncbi:MAG TPA: CAP domain-containing protein [Solirubrobacteraceae bacterium]
MLAVVAAACSLLLSAPPSVAAAACPGATLLPTSTDAAAIDKATLCLVNQVRAAHHLHSLRANRYLLNVAASQVTTMVSWDYFSDVRPSGQTPLSLVGVTRYRVHAASFAVGQNIAWGTESFASPEHIVQEWMASRPHRAVILTKLYRDAGVAVEPAIPGVLGAGRAGATYAMEFGVRKF